MPEESLIVKFMQVLKDEEENLKKNRIVVTAQLQYNLNLQEALKKLVTSYDATQNPNEKSKKRKK